MLYSVMVAPVNNINNGVSFSDSNDPKNIIVGLLYAIKTASQTDLLQKYLQATAWLSQNKALNFEPNEIYQAIKSGDEKQLTQAYLKWLTIKAYLLLDESPEPKGGDLNSYFNFLKSGQRYFEQEPTAPTLAFINKLKTTETLTTKSLEPPKKQKTFFISAELDSRTRTQYTGNTNSQILLINERLRAGLKMSLYNENIGALGLGFRPKVDYNLGDEPKNAQLGVDSAFLFWKRSKQLQVKIGKDYNWFEYYTKQYYDLPFDSIGIFSDDILTSDTLSFNARGGFSFFPNKDESKKNILENPCLFYSQAYLKGKFPKNPFEVNLGTMSFFNTTDLFSLTLNGKYTHKFSDSFALTGKADSILNFVTINKSSLDLQIEAELHNWLFAVEYFYIPTDLFLTKPLSQGDGQGFRLRTKYTFIPDLSLTGEYSLNQGIKNNQIDHRLRFDLEFKLGKKYEE